MARLLSSCFINACGILYGLMSSPKRSRRGRPAHSDDPPVLLATTVPQSVDRVLRELSAKTGRPRSELLSEAVQTLTRRYARIVKLKLK
jgi:hypothetical protein